MSWPLLLQVEGPNLLPFLGGSLIMIVGVVVPIFVATFVTSNAVGGGVFFEEFALFSPSQGRCYALGVSLLVSGVLLLATYGPGRLRVSKNE